MSKEYGKSVEEPEDELEKLIWAESSIREFVESPYFTNENKEDFQRTKNSLNFVLKLLQKEIGRNAFVKTKY